MLTVDIGATCTVLVIKCPDCNQIHEYKHKESPCPNCNASVEYEEVECDGHYELAATAT